MRMFSWLLVVLLLLALSTGVMAQEDEDEYEKDFMEVALFGGGAMPMGGISDWTSTTGTGTEALGTKFGYGFGFDVGHFLTARLVVGLNVSYAQFGIDSDTAAVATLHHRLISPAAYLKYYFVSESNVMPYLKAHAGVDVVKFTTRIENDRYRELSYSPAFAFGVGGGLFYYTHDYGGLYLEANYHLGLTKNASKSYPGQDFIFGETVSVLDIHAGIKVFFGSE